MQSEYDEVIRRCIDAQLEIERKAAAWDALTAMLDRYAGGVVGVDEIKRLVHPAQSSST
jgi:hypothetical protein